MESDYFAEQVFSKLDYRTKTFTKGEYECCQFINCEFSSTDLSDCAFSDCEFVDCNLSLVKLNHTAFHDVVFKGCKLLGVHFDTCNPFALTFQFQNCLLNQSVFYELKLRKMIFRRTQLLEVDFSDCDLTEVLFDECDLMGTIFDRTLLKKGDFRSSFNYSINPETNQIQKAKFSLSGLPGLLEKYHLTIDHSL